ncbi:MAG: SpoIIE family protein phosphatase [Candidatus Promineifilaceae bacterium]
MARGKVHIRNPKSDIEMPVTYANLLVVSDDDAGLNALLENLREITLYDVTVTRSLAGAVELAMQRPFDLVLLDMSMKEQCDNPAEFFSHWQERVPTPVIVMGRMDDIDLLSDCVSNGASDYLLLPTNATLLKARVRVHLLRRRLEEQALASLQAFNEVEKLADDLRLVILPLGIALSAENDFSSLIESFVENAMELCNADAGSLFLRTDDDMLHYAVVRVNSLGLAYGGTSGVPVPFADLPLFDEQGEPVLVNVATFAVHEELPVNIADIYSEIEFDFSGTKEFDARNHYRSVSCLTVPLRTRRVLGVLQLRNARDPQAGDIVPFGVYQQLVAESLASQAAVALQNRRLRAREASLLRYKRELEIGRDIQASFLPKALPQPPGWEIAARFYPAREVAGDFYDVYAAPGGRIGLAVADVCDKGVVAAMFMALLRSLLRAFVQQYYFRNTELGVRSGESPIPNSEFHTPHLDESALLDAIQLTNAYIGSNHADTHIFTTLFFAILDPQSGSLLYANCGHVPPVLRRADGTEQRLMPTGPAVGLLPDARFQVRQAQLGEGDLLFMYTDGVTEARNSQGEMFGEARLRKLRDEHAGESAEALLAAVETAVRDFIHVPDDVEVAGEEPTDDLTMLAVKSVIDER